MRLQWALLWLAASARGEEWTPPAPGELSDDEAEDLAAGELVAKESGIELEAVPAEAAAGSETAAAEEPARADGMTEI